MASDRLALFQQSLLGGAYKAERNRRVSAEETQIEVETKDRRVRKRSKVQGAPRIEPVYKMDPIKKPKGWKREYKSLEERKREAQDKENGQG